MIPKKNRFIGSRPIDRVYKTTRPIRAEAFNIRVKKNSTNSYRLAVVVSKKVSKSAVVRNRIRRRVFEHVRKNFSHTPKLDGCEVIVTVFEESVATIKSEELGRQLKKLFEKSGIK
jgi:ribonuclease P protein component